MMNVFPMPAVPPKAPKLALYTTEGCGYCLDVRSQVDSLGLPVEIVDVRQDPRRREELVKVRGRGTVPVLRVESLEDGTVTWLPESRDIIRYLRGLAGHPDPTPRWFDRVRDVADYAPWLLLAAGVITDGTLRAAVLAVGFLWLAARQIRRARMAGHRGRALLGALVVVLGVVAVSDALGWQLGSMGW
jgi:glutathione S-transferase